MPFPPEKIFVFTENLQTRLHTLWYTVGIKTFGRARYGEIY